jgi:hypothetical protein
VKQPHPPGTSARTRVGSPTPVGARQRPSPRWVLVPSFSLRHLFPPIFSLSECQQRAARLVAGERVSGVEGSTGARHGELVAVAEGDAGPGHGERVWSTGRRRGRRSRRARSWCGECACPHHDELVAHAESDAGLGTVFFMIFASPRMHSISRCFAIEESNWTLNSFMSL